MEICASRRTAFQGHPTGGRPDVPQPAACGDERLGTFLRAKGSGARRVEDAVEDVLRAKVARRRAVDCVARREFQRGVAHDNHRTRPVTWTAKASAARPAAVAVRGRIGAPRSIGVPHTTGARHGSRCLAHSRRKEAGDETQENEESEAPGQHASGPWLNARFASSVRQPVHLYGALTLGPSGTVTYDESLGFSAAGLQGVRRSTRVEDWFVPLLILAVWYMLQPWVLPRFGVPT